MDLYIGGVEHAVLHLLYSRFWHKVLFDLGYVDSTEPFHKLFNQGMIQAYAYTDDRGQYVPAAEVVEGPADANGEPTFTWNGQHANREFGKMGKSLKNIITPDDMYENYGADTFRLYEMGMGPLAESRPWNTRNVVGSMRFLQRLWRNVIDETTGEVRVTDGELDTKTLKLLNNTIADVTVEMEAMRPNTAIAKLIVLNNHLTSLDAVPRAAVEPLILMLLRSPRTSARKCGASSVTPNPWRTPSWPKADERYVGQDSVTAVVQIKGKVRAKLEVPRTSIRRSWRSRRSKPSPTDWAARSHARSSSRLRRSSPSFPRSDLRRDGPHKRTRVLPHHGDTPGMWITRVLRRQEPFRLDSMPMILQCWMHGHIWISRHSPHPCHPHWRTAALACRPPRSGCGDWVCPKNRPEPTALRPWRRNRINRPHHTNPHDRCRSGRRMTRNRHWLSSPASGRRTNPTRGAAETRTHHDLAFRRFTCSWRSSLGRARCARA